MSNRLILYGAGVAGKLFLEQILHDESYTVVAFVDDSQEAEGELIRDISVYPSSSLEELIMQEPVSKVIVTIPSLTSKRRKEISERLLKAGAEAVFLPSHQKIIEGSVELDSSSFSKIIGRDGSVTGADHASKAFSGLNVLVTGGGGSIGSEITRQLLLGKPKKLFVLDSSELNLFKLAQNLSEKGHSEIEYILGDFGDTHLLSRLLADNRIDYLFHAGAYKHVALVEDNIFAAVKNNVIGSHTLFNTVMSHDNGKAVNIVNVSTDKAVNPTNFMGATKRFVELLTGYFFHKFGNKIVNVRFGNVFGSSGSVIPIFVDQINQGGPVTVTHPDVERYFMSIPEAVELVLCSSLLSDSSGTYFLDMGNPIKILGLAKRLIKSFGFKPVLTDKEETSNNEIRICFSGLKSGEKLTEELSHSQNFKRTKNPKIFLCDESIFPLETVEGLYQKLYTAFILQDKVAVVEALGDKIVGYEEAED